MYFFPALFLFFADSEFTFNILTSQKKQKFFIIVFLKYKALDF